MATDIEEVYKLFPCAKRAAEDNQQFWDSEESLKESNMPQDIDTALKVKGGEEDLYNFFQQIIHHDHFLWKEGHITADEEKTRNDIIEQLTEKHLGFWHGALYHSPKVDEDFINNDLTYWKIICEDQF